MDIDGSTLVLVGKYFDEWTVKPRPSPIKLHHGDIWGGIGIWGIQETLSRKNCRNRRYRKKERILSQETC